MPALRPDYDVLIVGAGLSSTLTALRLKAIRPALTISLLEAAPRPDDSHTWCCFGSDLSPEQAIWLEPILSNRWPGYDVAFPALSRQLTTTYGRLSAADLSDLREANLPGATQYAAHAKQVLSDRVVLTDGRTLSAPLVIDGCGALPSPHVTVAFQKFVGLEVTLDRPHGLRQPIVMDAHVAQTDGYRFLYTLPLDEHRLLVEDTRYSDEADLSVETLSNQIKDYCQEKSWQISHVDRCETGVLPILLGGDFEHYWGDLGPAVPIGMRALLFHPTTGYSMPHAAALADAIAHLPELTTKAARKLVEGETRANWRRGAYLRLLNRMMFRAAAPDRRYSILQRFYGLPQPLIERFYANRLTWADRARILAGKPPVPVRRALGAIRLNARTPAHV